MKFLSSFLGRPKSAFDLVPLLDIEDQLIIDEDGRYCVGFQCYGIDTAHMPVAEQDVPRKHFYAALRDLPEGTRFQVLLSSGLQSNRIEAYRERARAEHPMFRVHAELRAQRLSELGAKGFGQWIFVQSDPCLGIDAFNPKSDMHRFQMAELGRRSVAVCQAFSSAGCHLVPLTGDETWSLMHFFMGSRGYTEHGPHGVIGQSPRQLLLANDLAYDNDGLLIDGLRHQVLSLAGLPNAGTLFTQAEVWQNLGIPFRATFHVEVPKQAPKRAELHRAQKTAMFWATREANVPKAEDLNNKSEAEQLSMTLASTGQKLLHVGLQVALWDRSHGRLLEKVQSVTEQLRQTGLRMVPEVTRHDSEFFKMAPGMNKAFDRFVQLTSNAVGDVLPLLGYPEGDHDALQLFHRPNGALVGHNPWGKTPPGMLIVGSSGAGKSVTTGQLITECITGQGVPVVIVDVGGEDNSSYLRLCQLMEGVHLPLLHREKNISINPLPEPALALKDGQFSAESLAFLVQFLALALPITGEPMERELLFSWVRKALIVLYKNWVQESNAERAKAPRLSHLLQVLQKLQARADEEGHAEDQRRLRLLVSLLEGFLLQPVAQHFDCSTQGVNTKSPFVVFDLAGINRLQENHQAALVWLVTHFINTRAYSGRTKKAVILDEVAQLLKLGPGFGNSLEELFATIRKHGGLVLAITQNWGTYHKAGLAEELSNNCGTMFFLKSKEQAQAQIVKDFGLSAREAELFKGLTLKKGEYSEFLMRTSAPSWQGGMQPITAKLRLYLSEFELALYTTTPADRDAQDAIIAAHKGQWSIAKCLMHWVQQRRAERAA